MTVRKFVCKDCGEEIILGEGNPPVECPKCGSLNTEEQEAEN